jgi:hypothetical protein
MPKSLCPKTESRDAVTPDAIAEDMRSCLPVIASPIQPCEPVPAWLARAARIAGIPAARARAYWHRKVESPRADEYVRVMAAAEFARRKQQVMEAAYEADRERFARAWPALARLLPPSLAATKGE